MKLSKRLNAIAELVSTNSVIDIGCDHAYLDIFLANKNINCIGTDISDKVLEQALKNLKLYNLENKVKLILSDGLTNIKIKQEDTLILSGLGTTTILKILEKYDNENDLIISSNNELEKLRINIIKKGYYISDEKVVFERNHCYVIIKFKKGFRKYNKEDYLFGPISKKDKLYLKSLLKKYNQILKNVPKKYILKRIYLKRILNKIKKLNKTI